MANYTVLMGLTQPPLMSPAPLNVTHPPVSFYYDSWAYKLRIYALIVLTVIGCCGNMLAFLVFVRSNMKRSSTGVYLISLAWLDSFCIVVELLLRSNALAVNDVTCKIAWCARTLLRLLEAFVVVAMCADRTICLRLPFKSKRCANIRCAIICLIVLAQLAFLLSSYNIKIMEKHGRACNFIWDDDYRHSLEILHFVVNTFIGEVLTSTLVIIMATYIIKALSSMGRRARRLSSKRPPASLVDKEVTRMTAALAFSFSLLRLPYSIAFITFFVRHNYIKVPFTENIQQGLYMTTEVFTVFSNMNYCINFIIYMLFWQAFKQKLWQLLRCKPAEEPTPSRRSSSRRITESTALS